jgi:transposase-like protein
VDSEPTGEGVQMSAPAFDCRASKGAEIARVESNVRRISKDEYRVKSQSGNGEYQVISGELGWLCNCPDAMYRGVKCKHQFAVELSLQIRRRIENARRVVPLDYQSCLRCGSEAIVKDGTLQTKGGPIQRFECKECGKKFSHNLGFEGMRASPEVITMAMQMYFGGSSLRNVQKALALQGVKVSHVAVLKWIRKYVGIMDEYLKGFTPQVGETWRADEMYVKFKGNMKYLFSMMDDETRFWIAQEVADRKEGHDARRFFRESAKAGGKVPSVLITDGLNSYGAAFNQVYSYTTGKHPVHIREISLVGSVHNNKMERMNGEIRDRERVMRGLKRTDTPIVKGLQIYHNFIRPHEALGGATPSERAGIKVEGENKWLTIIQNACHPHREEVNHA